MQNHVSGQMPVKEKMDQKSKPGYPGRGHAAVSKRGAPLPREWIGECRKNRPSFCQCFGGWAQKEPTLDDEEHQRAERCNQVELCWRAVKDLDCVRSRIRGQISINGCLL